MFVGGHGALSCNRAVLRGYESNAGSRAGLVRGSGRDSLSRVAAILLDEPKALNCLEVLYTRILDSMLVEDQQAAPTSSRPSPHWTEPRRKMLALGSGDN